MWYTLTPSLTRSTDDQVSTDNANLGKRNDEPSTMVKVVLLFAFDLFKEMMGQYEEIIRVIFASFFFGDNWYVGPNRPPPPLFGVCICCFLYQSVIETAILKDGIPSVRCAINVDGLSGSHLSLAEFGKRGFDLAYI